MNLNINVDGSVKPEISANVSDWLNEVSEWSSARYPGNDYETRLEVFVDTFENGWKVLPREPASKIYVGEISVIRWSYEAQRQYYLTNLFFDVDYKTGMQTAFANTLSYWIGFKGSPEQVESFDPAMTQQQEQFDWLEHSQPELLQEWIDRSGSLTDHIKNLNPEHWRFPAINKSLCRYGNWGPNALFPKNAGRS